MDEFVIDPHDKHEQEIEASRGRRRTGAKKGQGAWLEIQSSMYSRKRIEGNHRLSIIEDIGETRIPRALATVVITPLAFYGHHRLSVMRSI